ncbi:MAG: hypothetical protein HFJ35_00875 [Clostridia bacterium]|nr:hypothetical protein [Clostridia bacterium]
MSWKKEWESDQKNWEEEAKKRRKELAEKILEETLVPAFKVARNTDKFHIHGYAEVCIIAYPKKYVVIPMPYNTETVKEYSYPYVENEKIGVKIIWHHVYEEGKDFFLPYKEPLKFGKDGYIYVFSVRD